MGECYSSSFLFSIQVGDCYSVIANGEEFKKINSWNWNPQIDQLHHRIMHNLWTIFNKKFKSNFIKICYYAKATLALL